MCVLLTFLRSSCSPALVAPPLFRSSSHRRPSRCRPPHRCSCCRSHPHRFTSGLSSHRSSFVVALARRRLCPTAHRCPVAPLRRSTRWHCHTSHLPEVSDTGNVVGNGDVHFDRWSACHRHLPSSLCAARSSSSSSSSSEEAKMSSFALDIFAS